MPGPPNFGAKLPSSFWCDFKKVIDLSRQSFTSAGDGSAARKLQVTIKPRPAAAHIQVCFTILPPRVVECGNYPFAANAMPRIMDRETMPRKRARSPHAKMPDHFFLAHVHLLTIR